MSKPCNKVDVEVCEDICREEATGYSTCPCVYCEDGYIKLKEGECAHPVSGTCPLYGCPKHTAILKEETNE